jgi:hypothetical protein
MTGQVRRRTGAGGGGGGRAVSPRGPWAPTPGRLSRGGWLWVGLLVALTGCGPRLDPAPPMPPGEVVPGWTQEGVASWYGNPFHGRRTASGEVYDMEAPTAAHPGLPFGTMIRVENLDNGRSTVLRVNDRGPFARGRILDVSRHGARELGMIGPGTARVRVVVQEVPTPRDCWDVQVGSFQDRSNAEELGARLAADGWPVRLEPGPRGVTRVVAGPLVRVDARQLTARHRGLVMGCADPR